MKTGFIQAGGKRARLAFTLPEFMIAAAILSMALGGLMAVVLYGVKRVEILKPKLGLNDDARSSLTELVDSVRKAREVHVGSMATNTNATFVMTAMNTAQIGNALLVYATTNTTNWTVFFVHSGTNALVKKTNNQAGYTVVANFVSNTLAFTAENYLGAVESNNMSQRIISMNLEFYELRFPKVAIGPGRYYDFYRLRTKITRRANPDNAQAQ